jgi:hypothetical protein
MLELKPSFNDDHFHASVQIPGEENIGEWIRISDYTNGIDRMVKYFVAAQAKKHPLTVK